VVTHAEHPSPAFNLILGADDWHQTTRYCHAAALIGAPCGEIRPVFVVPDHAERLAAALMEPLLAPDGGPVVGIQMPNRLTGRHAQRAWPAAHVLELSRALAGDGCRVILCGHGREREEAAAICAQVPNTVQVPPAPLAVLAGIQRRFDLFIAPFSGTLHLADAVGVATVAYGQERHVSGWRPMGPRHRQCEGRSVAEIPVAPVLAAARELLAAAGS